MFLNLFGNAAMNVNALGYQSSQCRDHHFLE
jgi:hypothetical protein